jgi:hypothetical protein
MPRTHIFRTLVWGSLVAAAAVLLTATSALASPGQYGPHDTWYPYALSLTQNRQLDARHYALVADSRAQAVQQTAPTFTTDTLAPGGGSEQTPAVHFVTDTLAPGSGGTTTVVSTGDGFDWGDAGIGAATAIGAVLLASVAAVAMRRRGRLAY